jgi:coenzyme F420-reducing hydrogenase alpha subunit
MSEYIEKRWDLPTMEKRMECLKKVIDPFEVDLKVNYYLTLVTDDKLDALYLAYYDLKDKYCKIDRRKFGKPKTVDYKPKKIGMATSSYVGTYLTEPATSLNWYHSDTTTGTYNVYWEPFNYTWTVTTATNTL